MQCIRALQASALETDKDLAKFEEEMARPTGSGFGFCHACWMACNRALPDGEPRQPTWLQMRNDISLIDDTWHPIAHIQDRPDVRGLITVSALATASSLWNSMHSVLFLTAFTFQCYWGQTQQLLWAIISGSTGVPAVLGLARHHGIPRTRLTQCGLWDRKEQEALQEATVAHIRDL